MEILVIGNETNLKECREKFGEAHNYLHASHDQVAKFLNSGMIVFDFEPNDITIYDQKDLTVFTNSTKTTLSRLVSGRHLLASIFGFCGMPSFLNREILEVTTLSAESNAMLEKVALQLNTNYKIVEDRVGMATPRIICMIINEAFYTVEEGVASRSDIDLAMKLGTNYPFGPFEWCQKIGVRNVYELLNAVYEDAKDERYRICPLLREEAFA